ncbi:hypothetical protein RJ640_021523 [Escallonia rubra]|uniref:CCHC-type domain-containing protein n=1 Tax=Escallonia rubra TaxID=112253 RepID=A0AA88QA17_9ASTE|nr:hypothetical protein RJ640_021523 [Escallonia rubra]
MAERGGRGGRGRRGRNVTVDMFEELKDQVQNLTQLVTQLINNPNHGNDSDNESDRNSKEYGVQVHIAEFDGDMEPEGFLDWMDSIESYFDWKEVPEGRKVKLVGAKLRGPASTWWKHYQNDRDSRRKAKIQRWDKMKEKLKAQFLPRDYDQTLYQRVQNLRQHEKTVKEYTQEFHKLSLRSNLAETESQKVGRYVNGLRLAIQDQVSLQRPYKVSDAYQLALKVEIQLTRSSSRKLAYERNNNASTSRANNTTRGGRTIAPMRPQQQANTNGGRVVQGRPNTQVEIAGKCFRCFEFGHKSNQCPKRADIRVNLSEDQEARFEENFANFEGEDLVDACESNVFDEEGIEGDVIGEALVIRHSMLAPPANNNQDDWLRKNIFRTRCTAEGKLCNLIIDSGSSENLISQEMVDKLKLKTERHPQPYRILWFNKGNEVMVSSTCLVNFSIGSFKEAVYCDVVPMDACHILLGRPWQYDRKTMHDGVQNTYSFFVKDGERKKKLVLKPMKDDIAKKGKGCSATLLNIRDFLEESKESGIVEVSTKQKDRVERVIDIREIKTRAGAYLRFLVKWAGQPDYENSWLSEEEFMKIDPEMCQVTKMATRTEASSF